MSGYFVRCPSIKNMLTLIMLILLCGLVDCSLLFITMAGQPNPFSDSSSGTNTLGSMGFQHGSAEPFAGISYLDYMGDATPRSSPRSTSPRASPRGPRARSMATEQDEEYEARREERRESRRGAGGDLVGVTFRLNS